MDKELTINIIREYLISKNIKKAAIFGSFLRDDFNKKSDIDIVIEPFDHMTLWDMIHIQDDLKKKTKRRIDIIEYEGLKSYIKENVMSSALTII
ncbi:MAG: nucleotidyltransferase domain-containing protein [Bacteroidota bacterium]|nr:nucleotidyltransferase domain-containing protein [Bacteroidota bacterium]